MIKFSLSHNEVQRQCQKGMTPLLLAVPGNEQQKHNDDQIPGIKIPGQKLLQKSHGLLLIAGLGRRRTRRRRIRLRWGTGRVRRRRGLGRLPMRLFHPFALIGPVGLGNIAVIHSFTCQS